VRGCARCPYHVWLSVLSSTTKKSPNWDSFLWWRRDSSYSAPAQTFFLVIKNAHGGQAMKTQYATGIFRPLGSSLLANHKNTPTKAGVFLWWARRDSNPQAFWAFDFKSNTYTSSVTRPRRNRGVGFCNFTSIKLLPTSARFLL
jgi:hypothetical protein